MRKIFKLYKSIMLLTPEILMCTVSREQCITKLHELPTLVNKDNPKKEAAVLVPLCIVNGEVCLLFTLRSLQLSSHSGQVSFPGGKMDQGEDVFQTALRETEEEIGIPPNEVDIWSPMSRIQGRDSNMVITPIVGEIKKFDPEKLHPNENEVAEIFTVPMKVFCDKENHACFKYKNITIPVFICGKHKVWGITGIITHLFLECFLPKEVYNADFSRKEYTIDELLPSKL